MERKHGRTQSGLGLQGRVSSERSRVSVSECKKSDKMNIGCGASRVCGGKRKKGLKKRVAKLKTQGYIHCPQSGLFRGYQKDPLY